GALRIFVGLAAAGVISLGGGASTYAMELHDQLSARDVDALVSGEALVTSADDIDGSIPAARIAAAGVVLGRIAEFVASAPKPAGVAVAARVKNLFDFERGRPPRPATTYGNG